MAILGFKDIESIIEKPQASTILVDALMAQSRHKLHISGEGFQEILDKRMTGIESTNHHDIRKSISKPTTQRVFSSILNEFKKVFRAGGFVRNHKFRDGNTQLTEDFSDYLAGDKVAKGLSMQQIMEVVWFKTVNEDFNGVFMVEIPEVMESEQPEPFINFVEAEHIHDILVNGEMIEYIVLKKMYRNEQGERIEEFRVIDDSKDVRYIRKAYGELEIAKNAFGEDDIIPNPFGYVPAIQPSKLKASTSNDTLKKSYVSQVIPNADNYLNISMGHDVSVKLHQFPIFYSFPITCPTCNGSQRHEGEDCHKCNGMGKVAFFEKDTSQGVMLPEPEEGERFKAEAPCGYVTPDIESLREQRQELDWEEEHIEKGALGVAGILSKEKRQRETALGIELDLQPLLDLLSDFSNNGQQVESFLTNAIGQIRYGDDYRGSHIVWGKKFLVKTINEVEKEFEDAKKSGLPLSALKDILVDLLMTKYENNPALLARNILLVELEPFPTLTVKELVDLGVATRKDVMIKQYFNDFIEQIERDNGGEITRIFPQLTKASKVDRIKKDLVKMINKKLEDETIAPPQFNPRLQPEEVVEVKPNNTENE